MFEIMFEIQKQYVNYNNVTYFDSFGVEHIPKEILKLIGKKYYNKYL